MWFGAAKDDVRCTEASRGKPGSSRDLTIDLTEGNHVLICNMVMVEDDGTVEVHYALGMRTAFRVD